MNDIRQHIPGARSTGAGRLLFLLVPVLLLLSGCHHKDLRYETVESSTARILFDWQNAPDASPASMAVFLFNTSAEDGDEPLRYDFSGRDGGEVKIPTGGYSGLALNSDNTDWAHFRNTNDIDRFELYTAETSSLASYGLSTRAIPRAEGTEQEPIVATPGMIWTDRQDNLTLSYHDRDKTFIFYPEEAVCHYTVDVLDVENLVYLDGLSIDATLSGMSGGLLHGSGTPSDTKVTHPFILTADKDTDSLHGEFLAFGENPVHDYAHTLSLYVLLTDGSGRTYNFDVTSQVADAPDPRHVHIVVRGLSLPHTVSGSTGGLIPEVNDWQSENVDIVM